MQFIDLKAQYAALKTDIDTAIQQVLDHGQYIMGPEVAQLEAALAARVGVGHCVTVASGTEALLIALMALDLQPGDEVITSPFTFAATAEVIALLGGTIRPQMVQALRVLRQQGWVGSERVGRQVCYRLEDETVHDLLHWIGARHS